MKGTAYITTTWAIPDEMEVYPVISKEWFIPNVWDRLVYHIPYDSYDEIYESALDEIFKFDLDGVMADSPLNDGTIMSLHWTIELNNDYYDWIYNDTIIDDIRDELFIVRAREVNSDLSNTNTIYEYIIGIDFFGGEKEFMKYWKA